MKDFLQGMWAVIISTILDPFDLTDLFLESSITQSKREGYKPRLPAFFMYLLPVT